MTGQVRREDALVRKSAELRGPEEVVAAGAVQQHDWRARDPICPALKVMEPRDYRHA